MKAKRILILHKNKSHFYQNFFICPLNIWEFYFHSTLASLTACWAHTPLQIQTTKSYHAFNFAWIETKFGMKLQNQISGPLRSPFFENLAFFWAHNPKIAILPRQISKTLQFWNLFSGNCKITYLLIFRSATTNSKHLGIAVAVCV